MNGFNELVSEGALILKEIL